MKRALNELVIKSLPLTDSGQKDIWDTNLPRFGVRVGTRTKSYIFNTGKTRIVIGRVGITSLKDARDEARRRIVHKYLPHPTLSIEKAREEFLRAREGHLKPTTLNSYATYLKRLTRDPHEITAQYVYSVLPEGKGAANLCFNVFKAFLSWCLERDYIQHHPLLRRKQPNKLKSRDRLLTDEEVRAIWKESYNHNDFGTLVRLLLLTGQRLNQIASMQHPWISPTLLTFPATVMKAHNEHHLPNTPLIEKEITAATNSTSLQRTTLLHIPRGSLPKLMKNFREALNNKGHVNDVAPADSSINIPHFTLHDFRRYLSSTMAKLRIRQEVVERILAHKTGGAISPIAAVYNRHSYEDEMREALEAYHKYLVDLGCTSA